MPAASRSMEAAQVRRWRQRGAWLKVAAAGAAPVLAAEQLLRRARGRPGNGFVDKFCGRAPRRRDGPVLLHGVSLGEVNLLRPLAERLRATGQPVVVSTSTSSGWQAAGQHFAANEPVRLPYDLPWAVRRFLQTIRPTAVLLFECELWPVFLHGCHERAIPVAIVNGRVSDRSFAGYQRADAVLRPLLRRCRLGLGQTPTWTARLHQLGLPRVACTGSMKADMVRPADAATRDALATALGLPAGPASEKQVLLGASTGAGEEAAIIAAWRDGAAARGWRLVLCPRHPERGAAIADHCRQLGLRPWRSSQGGAAPTTEAIIIVDEIGKLAGLYANAAIAIVGGSLGSGRGGQNMLEAAAAACCTIVGPDTRNQPDGMALLRAADAVIESPAADLGRAIAPLLDDVEYRHALGQAARRAWQGGGGALERTWRHLLANGLVPAMGGDQRGQANKTRNNLFA